VVGRLGLSILIHFSEFESVYEERYQKRYGVLRQVVREVIYKYLGCGDLRKGFARIKCKDCKHEVLLAFPCKGRYFCPSCHQKRVPLLHFFGLVSFIRSRLLDGCWRGIITSRHPGIRGDSPTVPL
jgi:hypothetical protein